MFIQKIYLYSQNKITLKSLDELAKIMPVLSEEEQRTCIGGSGFYIGDNDRNKILETISGGAFSSEVQLTGATGDAFSGGAKGIMDNRGAYMPRGSIYSSNMEIRVRLPIGNVDMSASSLNVLRISGKTIGVLGMVSTVTDIASSDPAVAAAKATVAAASTACKFIPGIGWAISLGISIADYIWGETLYEWIDKKTD